MRKILLTLLLFPLLSFARESHNGIAVDDWYRVRKEFQSIGWWGHLYTLRPGDKIYVYGFYYCDYYNPKIALLDASGKYLSCHWMSDTTTESQKKLANPEYCTFLENREDKRYK